MQIKLYIVYAPILDTSLRRTPFESEQFFLDARFAVFFQGA